jgi:hypothetical protein
LLALILVVEDPSKGYRVGHRYPPETDEVHNESLRTLNELCNDANGKTVSRFAMNPSSLALTEVTCDILCFELF